ncbi:MAG: hypothetical protein AAGI03_10635 [Pseudomonadota bacterium]
MTTETLATDLDAWCQSYVAAFSDYDIRAISAHWCFPAVILAGGAPVLLGAREKFDRNTERLCAFYRDQGVTRAERSLIKHLPMTAHTAAIIVKDTLLDEAGGKIVSWDAAYTLTLTPDGWRACLADAGGEMAAWTARGTPLGGG